MDPVTYDEDLRERLRANLAAHERVEIPLADRRPAAVAIVLVDSDPRGHDREPLAGERLDMTMVPGATVDQRGRALDGRMVGVAGGAAFLLCRRASRLNRHAGQWRCRAAGSTRARPRWRPRCAS